MPRLLEWLILLTNFVYCRDYNDCLVVLLSLAILKRLLLTSMACSLVWNLQRNESEEVKEFKRVLVRLNGKSQKHGSPPTEVTLLSGLFVLLRLFDLLELMDYDM